MGLKKYFTNFRIIILIIFLILSITAINPWFREGASIRQVVKDSPADLAGIVVKPGLPPTQREIIKSLNNYEIKSSEDFYKATTDINNNDIFLLKTNKGSYEINIKQSIDELKKKLLLKESNLTNNSEENLDDLINSKIKYLGLTVTDAPYTNLRKGLDLSGGTRVILKPEHQVSFDDLNLIIDNIKERLNVFGLSDIIVRSTKDLNGDYYILVEIAGANKDEVRSLLANQGLFEAKIGNKTVFKGGKDIVFVCRSPDCSGLDARSGGCQKTSTGYACRFSFAITLSEEAADRQARATENLDVITKGGSAYLSQPLDLFLDGEKVDTLQIAADLKGKAVTDIQISGSGFGKDYQEAVDNTINNMKKLQTILITGSLPVKLKIVKIDSISPLLGKEFIKNALIMALAAIIAVAIVIFLRYKDLAISLGMLFTMLSEAIIILGFASFVGWNLDLAAIAGIIIAIGTGVDDQIVIVEETLRDKKGKSNITIRSWKEKIKNAFFIIFASYATTVVAMLPLWFAGAGLLRGFAITTIIGVSAGVFITRPAFAAYMELLIKEKEEKNK